MGRMINENNLLERMFKSLISYEREGAEEREDFDIDDFIIEMMVACHPQNRK